MGHILLNQYKGFRNNSKKTFSKTSIRDPITRQSGVTSFADYKIVVRRKCIKMYLRF